MTGDSFKKFLPATAHFEPVALMILSVGAHNLVLPKTRLCGKSLVNYEQLYTFTGFSACFQIVGQIPWRVGRTIRAAQAPGQ